MAGVTGIVRTRNRITTKNAAQRKRAASRYVGVIFLQGMVAGVKYSFLQGGRDEGGRTGIWAGLLVRDSEGNESRTKNVREARKPRVGRRGTGRSILIWTGALMRSIGIIKRAILTAGIWTFAIGTNLVQAATLHFGDPRRNIIDRPFWPIPRREMDILFQDAMRYILTGKK